MANFALPPPVPQEVWGDFAVLRQNELNSKQKLLTRLASLKQNEPHAIKRAYLIRLSLHVEDINDFKWLYHVIATETYYLASPLYLLSPEAFPGNVVSLIQWCNQAYLLLPLGTPRTHRALQ